MIEMIEMIKNKIKDILLLHPKVHSDSGGYFFESYNKNLLLKNGFKIGVLRGTHFQNFFHLSNLN